jgi:hypothetical protein
MAERFVAPSEAFVDSGQNRRRHIGRKMFVSGCQRRRRLFVMSTAHVSSLTARHAHIDAQLDKEQNRPRPDGELIAALKKQKLRLKETIARL